MILLVGGDSEIGAATEQHLREAGCAVTATTRRAARGAPNRPLLDLAAPLADWQPPRGTTAACLFAAVARLAACEADAAASTFINVRQTLALADILLRHGAHVVFLSSNQVFDGATRGVPPDAPHCPVSTYGRQKAEAETTLLERARAGMPVAILRLAKVVSPGMPLLRDWAQALKRGQTIRPFHDMTMAPVPVETVARAIAALIAERAVGVFQLTGPRDVTYAEVARELARRLGAAEDLIDPVSASTAGMPPGATPPHTTLDSTLMRERYGLVVPDAFEMMAHILASSD